MLRKIKQLVLISLSSAMLLVPALAVPALNGLASADIQSNLCTGADAAAGNPSVSCATATTGSADSGLEGIAKTITRWFSIVVGAVSIIMIIYGGFRYITSGGASDKVGNAKNTLIYAIIGLVIVALAQLIVRFVITQANNNTTPIG